MFLQLAVATADLALQFVGWEKPVEDVVDKYMNPSFCQFFKIKISMRFRLKTSSENMLTLLEFLTALPEEVISFFSSLKFKKVIFKLGQYIKY